LSEENNISKIVKVLEKIHHKKFDLNIIAEKEYALNNEGNFEDIERAINTIRSKINFDVEVK